MTNDPFIDLETNLPPIITRHQAAKLLGGLIAAGTLANLDSEGRGPAVRIIMGRKVAYPRKELVQWLRQRANLAGDRHE